MREDEERVEFEDATCLRETDKALLCLIDGEEEWIPKSQVCDESEVFADGHQGTLIVTLWIAKEKGLI